MPYWIGDSYMKPTADPDPEDLLRAARTGDGAALGRLLEGYRRYLTLLAPG